MKNKATKSITFLASVITSSILLFTACDDWNDLKSIELNEPNIETQNPELYAKYLESLKAYKESDHKVIYAWFNNSLKTPADRSHHVADLPDSIDVVVLMHPDNLSALELREMAEIREKKGTRTLFVVDYDAIKQTYDQLLFDYESGNDPDAANPGVFDVFLTDSLTQRLTLVGKYNYDGIIIGYTGKSTIHMEDDEKTVYIHNEKLLFDLIAAWRAVNPAKTVNIKGYPQYFTDKSLLNSYTHIILPTATVTSAGALAYTLSMACAEGIPTDRFVVMAQNNSLDPEDTKTGYWVDGNPAIASTATWASKIYSAYSIAGFAIHEVNNDYFNPVKTYPKTRNAIEILNPSF